MPFPETARACGGTFNEVRWRWLKSLKRRSQRGIHELGEVHQHHRPLLPVDQDTTSTALSPFRRQNPREEPGALAAHAGICAGGGEKSSSLPRPSIGAPKTSSDATAATNRSMLKTTTRLRAIPARSELIREHFLVMAIPIALEDLARIVAPV